MKVSIQGTEGTESYGRTIPFISRYKLSNSTPLGLRLLMSIGISTLLPSWSLISWGSSSRTGVTAQLVRTEYRSTNKPPTYWFLGTSYLTNEKVRVHPTKMEEFNIREEGDLVGKEDTHHAGRRLISFAFLCYYWFVKRMQLMKLRAVLANVHVVVRS